MVFSMHAVLQLGALQKDGSDFMQSWAVALGSVHHPLHCVLQVVLQLVPVHVEKQLFRQNLLHAFSAAVASEPAIVLQVLKWQMSSLRHCVSVRAAHMLSHVAA